MYGVKKSIQLYLCKHCLRINFEKKSSEDPETRNNHFRVEISQFLS